MKDHFLKLKHVLDQERRTEETVLLIKYQPFWQEEKNKKKKPNKTPTTLSLQFLLIQRLDQVLFQLNILSPLCGIIMPNLLQAYLIEYLESFPKGTGKRSIK